MNIIQIVRGVENLFRTLEKDIGKLQMQTGIRCAENCIYCCTTPKIEATVIEFFPLAYHLYKTAQAGEILNRIEQLNNDYICPVLNHLTFENSRPGCMQYEHRGLICRLFAYNYVTDKYGVKRINTCKTIKIDQPQEVEKANQMLLTKNIAPKASDYYSRLQFLHFNEARTLYPISKAVKVAIEMVITHFHYSGKKVV